jgi:hypothetical protein
MAYVEYNVMPFGVGLDKVIGRVFITGLVSLEEETESLISLSSNNTVEDSQENWLVP